MRKSDIDKRTEKDIEMAWEEFMGTTTGKICYQEDYAATTAIEFCKFYLKRKKG